MAAEKPTPPLAEAARETFRALLRVTREHLRRDDSGEAGLGSSSTRIWHRVQAYLHEHYAEPLTREVVAEVVGVHPNYLSALCRRHGPSFQQSLEAVRLERACYLLRSSDLKIEAIARACGYESAGYFIKVFRRAFGQTPKQMRISLP
jgi:AraC-like DNA-binding protein